MEIIISSSIIKSFFDNGEQKAYCPRKVKACTIDRTHSEEKDVFTYGKYFEIACGIGTAYPDEPEPRIKRGALTEKQKKEAREAGIHESELQYLGAMLVDEKRILQQAENFKYLAPFYGINTDNCQVKLEQEYATTIKKGVTVILKGTADIISPFYNTSEENDIYYENSVIDLKLTGNIYSSYNNRWSWKFPADKDHTQAKLYSFMTGLPFVYAVFDYTPDCNYIFYPVILNSVHTATLKEDIRKTVETILYHNENGWSENANYDSCKSCPLARECSKKVKVKPSIPICPSH